MAQAPVEMAIGVAKLLTNPVHSDFSFGHKDHEWKLHKIVLATQSTFFARLFEKDPELPDGIDLPVEHVDPIDAMLQYLYTSDYSGTSTSHGEPYAHPPIVLDVLVYTLARAVDILPLAEKAAFSFCKRAERDWATPGFAQAVRALYEQAPNCRTMRRVAVMTAARHAQELVHESYGAEFRAVVREVKAFGADIQSVAIVRGGV